MRHAFITFDTGSDVDNDKNWLKSLVNNNNNSNNNNNNIFNSNNNNINNNSKEYLGEVFKSLMSLQFLSFFFKSKYTWLFLVFWLDKTPLLVFLISRRNIRFILYELVDVVLIHFTIERSQQFNKN